MAYKKTDWKEGAVILADALNNMEDGIAAANTGVAKNAGAIEANTTAIREITEETVAVRGMVEGSLYVSMPSSVNVKVGSELKIYYRNVISRNDARLWIGYHNSLTTRYYDDYLSITPTAAGTFSLSWKVYDDAGNQLRSGKLSVVAGIRTARGTTKALVIGDSTVNAGIMTSKLSELYSADSATLTLLGTRGSGTNKHEGRGGWTAKMYCNTIVDAITGTNPFVNLNTLAFDFGYYMTSQGYSEVHAVAIQLGINDIFSYKDNAYNSEAVLGYFDQIVESIHAYDSNIKIIINLPTTPNSNGTSFTETYGTTQLYWIYSRNIIRFAEELQAHYANNSSVTISASNCILDTKTQIRDGVHPTEEGYNALGGRLYEVMSEKVVNSLVNVLERTQKKHTVITINATDAHALKESYCYDTAFNGVRSSYVSNRLSYTALSKNSFSLEATVNSGIGIEFPVPSLVAGNSYTLTFDLNETNARVYLMKYDATTTAFSSYIALTTTGGAMNYVFTAEEGYIYSFMFTTINPNTLMTVRNFELYQN